MKSRLLKLCASLACVAAAFAFAGCNTMEGAGEDIQSAGEAIEDAAD